MGSSLEVKSFSLEEPLIRKSKQLLVPNVSNGLTGLWRTRVLMNESCFLAGILVSFSNGQVSNTEWVYSTHRVSDWADPYLDDLDWKRAVAYGKNGNCRRCPWGRNQAGFRSSAQWIWSNNWRHREVYFRFYVELGE